MNKNLPAGISPLRSFSSLAKPTTINFGLGKPHEDMPKELRSLASDLLLSPLRMDYSDNAGLPEVRRLLEEHYHLPTASSLLTHGAQEGIYATLTALLNVGDEVLVPDPGFLAYAPIIKTIGAKPFFYSLARTADGFQYSLTEIRKKVTRKTKVVLINSPANPTGSIAGPEFLRELAQSLKNQFIVSDEVYGELHFSDPYIPFARYEKNVVSINSFSKSHALTGWRIGWVACQNEKLRNKILVAHQYLSTCASVPAQHLVGALLANPALFERIRDRYCADYLLRRDELFRNLGAITADVPPAGFYAFLPIPKKFKDSLSFAEFALKKKDVMVIPGEFFGRLGKRHVRLSYGTSLENIRKGANLLAQCY